MKDNLTKSDLIDAMASEASISKSAAEKSLSALLETIIKGLKKGRSTSLVGLGTFSVNKRAARKGRNPKTGEEIKIPAAKVPKFKASAKLKSTLN